MRAWQPPAPLSRPTGSVFAQKDKHGTASLGCASEDQEDRPRRKTERRESPVAAAGSLTFLLAGTSAGSQPALVKVAKEFAF